MSLNEVSGATGTGELEKRLRVSGKLAEGKKEEQRTQDYVDESRSSWGRSKGVNGCGVSDEKMYCEIGRSAVQASALRCGDDDVLGQNKGRKNKAGACLCDRGARESCV